MQLLDWQSPFSAQSRTEPAGQSTSQWLVVTEGLLVAPPICAAQQTGVLVGQSDGSSQESQRRHVPESSVEVGAHEEKSQVLEVQHAELVHVDFEH